MRSFSPSAAFIGPATRCISRFVVKQRNWLGKLAGLPIETEVVDARDLKVQTKKLALPPERFRGGELTRPPTNPRPANTRSTSTW